MRSADPNVNSKTAVGLISAAKFAIQQTSEAPFYSQSLNNVCLQIGRFHGQIKLWKKYEERRNSRGLFDPGSVTTLKSMGKRWKGAQHGN
jgi:hypothetical protein